MPILKDLPKEIPEGKFEEFLQKIEQDFPEDEFPEIFVKYYKTDKKAIILGMGESVECARQTLQSLEKMPSLKGKEHLKILRIPPVRLQLR